MALSNAERQRRFVQRLKGRAAEIAALQAAWNAEREALQAEIAKFKQRDAERIKSEAAYKEAARQRAREEAKSREETPVTNGTGGRDRIRKLVAMLSTDNEGELLAAAKKLKVALTAEGMSFHDLAERGVGKSRKLNPLSNWWDSTPAEQREWAEEERRKMRRPPWTKYDKTPTMKRCTREQVLELLQDLPFNSLHMREWHRVRIINKLADPSIQLTASEYAMVNKSLRGAWQTYGRP